MAYETASGRTDDFPIDDLDSAKPVYEELDGWKETLGEVRTLDDLPKAARQYVRYLEAGAGAPVYLVSVGARRRETIVLHNPFVGRADAP